MADEEKSQTELSREAMAGTYPKDTIGFHYLMAKLVFGDESPATKFLANKAAQCDNGLNEKVVMDESQVIYMLYALDQNAIRADERGELIPDARPEDGND